MCVQTRVHNLGLNNPTVPKNQPKPIKFWIEGVGGMIYPVIPVYSLIEFSQNMLQSSMANIAILKASAIILARDVQNNN